jgi:uncharacterized protein YndB with AHSA1/START domain
MSISGAEVLKLRLERLIRADRQRVYDAWTQPDLLRIWSAPEGAEVESGEQDLRVGGKWGVVMVEESGARHEAFGTYREIDPPKRLVYTHAWRQPDGGSSPETVLTVEFHPAEGGTLLVLRQEGFASADSRDGHGEGWSSAFGKLERLLEAAPSRE